MWLTRLYCSACQRSSSVSAPLRALAARRFMRRTSASGNFSNNNVRAASGDIAVASGSMTRFKIATLLVSSSAELTKSRLHCHIYQWLSITIRLYHKIRCGRQPHLPATSRVEAPSRIAQPAPIDTFEKNKPRRLSRVCCARNECPREDSNLHSLKRELGPEPSASANSATWARLPITHSKSVARAPHRDTLISPLPSGKHSQLILPSRCAPQLDAVDRILARAVPIAGQNHSAAPVGAWPPTSPDGLQTDRAKACCSGCNGHRPSNSSPPARTNPVR